MLELCIYVTEELLVLHVQLWYPVRVQVLKPPRLRYDGSTEARHWSEWPEEARVGSRQSIAVIAFSAHSDDDKYYNIAIYNSCCDNHYCKYSDDKNGAHVAQSQRYGQSKGTLMHTIRHTLINVLVLADAFTRYKRELT